MHAWSICTLLLLQRWTADSWPRGRGRGGSSSPSPFANCIKKLRVHAHACNGCVQLAGSESSADGAPLILGTGAIHSLSYCEKISLCICDQGAINVEKSLFSTFLIWLHCFREYDHGRATNFHSLRAKLTHLGPFSLDLFLMFSALTWTYNEFVHAMHNMHSMVYNMMLLQQTCLRFNLT